MTLSQDSKQNAKNPPLIKFKFKNEMQLHLICGLDVGSLVCIRSKIILIGLLFFPPSKQEESQLPIEGQVDPGIHHTVQRQ